MERTMNKKGRVESEKKNHYATGFFYRIADSYVCGEL